MAGVHRSLQFPSLSAQPCAPASALLTTCTCMSTYTHLRKQTTAPRPEPRRHRLTLSCVNTQKHVKLYNVLNCHLDNMLGVSLTSQARALFLLFSSIANIRAANEHSAPPLERQCCWDQFSVALNGNIWLSMSPKSPIICPMIYLDPIFLFLYL